MSDRDNSYGNYSGRWPGVVKEYDAARRMCRVEIPGMTDGAELYPWAEIEYPIGDKSLHGDHASEIEILPEDAVWIAFIGGDSRYPIITGYRNARAGNSTDWRLWHHANVKIKADDKVQVESGGAMGLSSEAELSATATGQMQFEAGEQMRFSASALEFASSGSGSAACSGTFSIQASAINLN